MKKNNDKNNDSGADAAASSGKKLDRVDRRMIHLLQKDGRLPNKTIAGELGISEFTVRREERLARAADTNRTPCRHETFASPRDQAGRSAGQLAYPRVAEHA